jgi:hypothetical protein
MPFSLYKRLDIEKLVSTDISLQMADKSTTIPIGICENVGVVGDVVTKAAAPEVNHEEMAPVVVVVLGEVDGNWDKVGDIGYGVCKGEKCSHGGVGGGRSRV